MQFDIKKNKEIMEHIDEDEEDDMEIESFTDRDILNKVRKNGYYNLNGGIEALKKLEKELNEGK